MSPYKKILQMGLTRLREQGNLHIIWERNRIASPQCSSPGGNVKGLGLMKLCTLFMMVGLGFIGSGLLLILEAFGRPNKKKMQSSRVDPKAQLLIQSAMEMLAQVKTVLPHGDQLSKELDRKVDDVINSMSQMT